VNYYIRKNLSIEESIRAIGEELVNEAVEECSSTQLSNHEIIHESRKRCKRLRGLVRIVRPEIGFIYQEENIFFRDLARKLSLTRDQHASTETLRKLQKRFKNKSLHRDIDFLISKIELSEDITESNKLIKDFEKEISESFSRIKNWKVNTKGFDAIEGGLRKTYIRGRLAMREAFISPTSENYHEWRKRAKYHYYHLELLTPIWGKIMKAYTNEAHGLSELLGYDHDLCLLYENLNASDMPGVDEIINGKILEAISKEQSKLRNIISILGKKIYSEKPDVLLNRIGRWWSIWEKEK
jgi:CHAD domain-containing protein